MYKLHKLKYIFQKKSDFYLTQLIRERDFHSGTITRRHVPGIFIEIAVARDLLEQLMIVHLYKNIWSTLMEFFHTILFE